MNTLNIRVFCDPGSTRNRRLATPSNGTSSNVAFTVFLEAKAFGNGDYVDVTLIEINTKDVDFREHLPR